MRSIARQIPAVKIIKQFMEYCNSICHFSGRCRINQLQSKFMLEYSAAVDTAENGVAQNTVRLQYAQGADDLFNLSNKVFGVFLPPIAIPMLCGIFVRRLSKRSGMVALVGGIAVGLCVFVVGGAKEYAYLREMVWVFPITAAATVALLAVGSKIFPDKAEERAEVDGFFDKIEGR